MAAIYIFGSPSSAQQILAWLSESGGIASAHVAAIADPKSSVGDPARRRCGVPVLAVAQVIGRLTSDDIVIVTDGDVDGIIDALFRRDFFNIYDGGAVIRDRRVEQRFLTIGESLHIGPSKPAHLDPDYLNSRRYFADPLVPGTIPCSKLFVVNSMPKSGTVWMMAMVAELLGVNVDRQIILSHVRDIENDWRKRTVHGALALVRDMRDVVVSWYHHVQRSDLQGGFAQPRYADPEVFYFDYFIGQIFGNARFYHGDLAKWLDFVGLNSIPVVRYEDLIADAGSCLGRVMTFWKVEASNRKLEDTVRDYRFDAMPKTVADHGGMIAERLSAGHLHRGRVGAWQEELPARVLADIERRFHEYQKRLRYA
ncbi:MAG: sulfotransferase domain-containing protein [Gammaproteobacteria bacterium]